MPEGFCISTVPDYYLNIEFALLSVLKNASAAKCGFNLTFKDRSHDFIVVSLESLENAIYNMTSTTGYGCGGVANGPPEGTSQANMGGVAG